MGFEVGGLRVCGDFDVGGLGLRLAGLSGRVGLAGGLDQGVGSWKKRQKQVILRWSMALTEVCPPPPPESLLSGASVLTPTPLELDTPLMARFCTW